MLRVCEKWIRDIFEGAVSLVFPSRCAGCGAVDRPALCTVCRSQVVPIMPGVCCSCCGDELEGPAISGNALCARCRENRRSFAQAVSAYRYTEPLSDVIVEWKYRERRQLSEALAELLTEWVRLSTPPWWDSVQVVVPVPHHPRTVHLRGFSPPEDLACRLANSFGLVFLPRVLFKTRFTPPQTGLDLAARAANVHMAMKVFDSELVQGRVVLVVDDVMTTGATVEECARALMKAGAKQVYCLTLARQAAVM